MTARTKAKIRRLFSDLFKVNIWTILMIIGMTWSVVIQPAVARDFPTRAEMEKAIASIQTKESREHEEIRSSQRDTERTVNEGLKEVRGDVKEILRLMIEQKGE